jgi:circadian clock protein KaiB
VPKHSANKRAVRSPRFKFSVYIASQTRQSELALARLRKICDEEIPANYEIEIIDLAKNPHLAKEHQIVATPSIFRTLPAPVRKSIGNLSKADKTLLGLDLWNGKIALRGTDQSKGTGA